MTCAYDSPRIEPHQLGCYFYLFQPMVNDEDSRTFGISARSTTAAVQRATYSDRRRQWSHRCPPQRLEHLLNSAATTEQVVEAPSGPINLIQSSQEARTRQLHQPSSGRTLQDAIDVTAQTVETEETVGLPPSSALEQPLILAKKSNDDGADKKPAKGLLLTSKFELSQKESADATRRYIDIRNEYHAIQQQIQGLKRSLKLQEESLVDFVKQRDSLSSQNGSMEAVSKQIALDEIQEGEQNANRVISQLERQLSLLQAKDDPLAAMLHSAKEESIAKYRDSQSLLSTYRDPFYTTSAKPKLAQMIIGRASGLRMLPFARNVERSIPQQIEGVRKNITMRRLSHGATINTHLSYPIYCLRFDRTGRYFITGADDYLSRVFCLGSHAHAKKGSSLDPISHQRGAVLVCTLRGHAGVINDIAVSPDNAFLATASEDGDCRVWGLRDGSPIAILRGHTGGANMVSWSMLTPYRLVTAGADGYAKCWDIREACVLRYGSVVGKRFEYKRRKIETSQAETEHTEEGIESGVTLPPIPERPVAAAPLAAAPSPGFADERGTEPSGQDVPAEAPQVPVPLPPLPPGAQQNQQQEPVPLVPAEGEEENGRFLAGDGIDEGVQLLSRMQHGAAVDESVGGHGTRSRRTVVKVLCVDACPRGQYIATGADDGMCRIFPAIDDAALERLDIIISDKGASADAGPATSSRQSIRLQERAESKVLATLKGHLTAITDLKYSYAGDRLLSASQRDGVVRIWSSPGDPVPGSNQSGDSPSYPTGSSGQQNTHVLIKLTNPEKAASAEVPSRSNRQRPSRSSSAASISCDVAAWLTDDSKIVTSQCELMKQTSSDIQPGSQYIFVWDSFTGQCLLGIRGSHTMQCPVVLPHPMLPSVLCSAGADGIIKMWDLELGKCILEHKNTVDFGPVEARDRGMISGYLDGSFSPDGTEVVLTDDCGRLTVLDCIDPVEDQSFPGWMREQYFANDYYELCYDRHGYCIERGSEQPPHLAPRGVRCSFSGAPWSEHVNAAFKGLVGPLPDPQNEALWSRLRHRQLSRLSQRKPLRRSVVSHYDPETTVMIGLELEQTKQAHVETQEAERTRAAQSPRLSSNWRWRDYSDILREEGQGEDDEVDADDASYELNEPGNRRTLQDDDDDSDMGDFEQESPVRSNRRQSGPEANSSRSGRNRRQSNASRFFESDSEDDEMVEFMSSNNTPSGPFRADYDTHLFRISTGVGSISRDWVHRIESTSAYLGRKSYCPQVGDDVVYIPRAHFEVISVFPSSPPWQSWPDGVEWPVVSCKVRSVRYRFPHRDFFSRNKSIVAILTLEINGIPELSRDREIPWPKPTFVDLPRRHIFEVSMFETDEPDFIVPIGLYIARLSDLEKVILENDATDRRVQAFYAQCGDDSELMPYDGFLKGWDDENFDSSDANLLGSGYRCLHVSWADGDYGEDELSPWEIALHGSDCTQDIPRPKLSDPEKRQVRDALTQVRSIHDVEKFLVHPVDTSRYTDYESRVENPMWLDFVRNRLDSDYYASRLSVIYDVKLIRENSRKYNGEDELTETASAMYEKFCELVLTEEELAGFRDFEKNLEVNALERARLGDVADGENTVRTTMESGGVVRRSRRQVQNRSSLESLPPPGESVGRRPQRQRSSSARRPQRRSNGRNVSILETSASNQIPSTNRSTRTRGLRRAAAADTNIAPVAPVVPLNSGNRGRTSRNSRGQQPNRRQVAQRTDSLASSQAEDAVSRAERARLREVARSGHSLRSRGGNHPSYADPPEDEDMADSELEELTISPRTRRRHGNGSLENSTGGSVGESELSRTRRTRSSLGVAAGPPDDVASGSSRRSRRRDDAVNEENPDESPNSNDRSRRMGISVTHPQSPSAAGRPTRASTRRISTPESNVSDREEPEVPKRDTRRASRRRSESSGESDAEQDATYSEESEAEEMGGSGDEEEGEATRTNRKRARSSPSRRVSRSRAQTTYEDPSPSEFESDGDESDASENKRPVRKDRGRAKKKSSPKKPPKKKAKGKPSRPNPAPWPEMPRNKIFEVGEGILDRLAIEDDADLFAAPVLESVPELSEEYSASIPEPMDFRTIRQERLGQYDSIRELQNDLITVFHNCIVFNGLNNEYGQVAK